MSQSQYGIAFRYIHFSLIVFGLSSYFTGEWVEEYDNFGFWIHSVLGISLTVTIVLRVIFGLSASTELNFIGWGRKIKNYRKTVFEDLKLLSGLKLPEREMHEGIAGVVQAFGLIIFLWMSITGSLLFFIELHFLNINEDLLEELHEAGEILVPVFLLLHIGAVVFHYIKGDNLLVKINPFKK